MCLICLHALMAIFLCLHIPLTAISFVFTCLDGALSSMYMNFFSDSYENFSI